MSNIDTISQDLVTRVKTVSSFSNRVGFTVGGQDMDPLNRDLDIPAAWCVYTGDEIVSVSPMNPCSSLIKLNFVVKVLVPYPSSETTLLTTYLPLLHEVVSAIQGGSPVSGSKWLYEGQGLTEMSERLVWDQSYSVQMGI